MAICGYEFEDGICCGQALNHAGNHIPWGQGKDLMTDNCVNHSWLDREVYYKKTTNGFTSTDRVRYRVCKKCPVAHEKIAFHVHDGQALHDVLTATNDLKEREFDIRTIYDYGDTYTEVNIVGWKNIDTDRRSELNKIYNQEQGKKQAEQAKHKKAQLEAARKLLVEAGELD